MMDAFGELKVSLSDNLTKDDCHRLCTFFNCPRAKQETILSSNSRGLELIDFLTEREFIKATNVTKLWEALTKLKLQVAASQVHEYALSATPDEDTIQEQAVIPEDNESDDESGCSDTHVGLAFEDLLDDIGLKEYFPQCLELETLVKIKDVSLSRDKRCIAELFWQKLSSLDYRVRSSHFFQSTGDTHFKKCSIRDFIFALLHCSESSLRQDIIEKLSLCHLAVPIILQGINGSHPEFLLWSLRRIIKKWTDSNSVALEQHIVQVPLFTVSFIRISDINDVSKSSIINTLLGVFQGNDPHPFFLTKNEDAVDAQFSKGCVEAVWYLPMEANASEKLKKVSLFLNLRGDCTQFPEQTRFVYQASQLTIVFIADRNRQPFSTVCNEIITNAKAFLFIVVNDNRSSVPPKRKKVKLSGNNIYVRSTDLDGVVQQISERLTKLYDKLDSTTFTSVENLKSLCGKEIDVEEDKWEFRDARAFATNIIEVADTNDLSDYKRLTFPLQEKWLAWVAIDKERQSKRTPKDESVEFFREEIQRRKDEIRRAQLKCGLSVTMQRFKNILSDLRHNKKTFGYFLSYLQDDLCRLVDAATKNHLQQIDNYEKAIGELDVSIKSKSLTNSASVNNPSDAEMRWKNSRKELKRLHIEENEKCREKNIGWEHFIRELGQFHEAHTELTEPIDADVMSLPDVAAQLLLNGQLLEIMDGDTGHVALSWITSVLDTLTHKLGDPKILVLCVVGAQSSGKSTFLNSMFGVKFPARAGRCTRGLFLRMLPVDQSHADILGFKYIFLVDSEGIRSIERNYSEEYRFDNELVTFALCISDVTILNIEGEHIGPETTGLLGIAAHAFMRMKEVDLQSQCRIIQQKVSDLTARERNKLTMNHIKNTLDNATKEAARQEGYFDRYQEFSDVFELRLDENLQFIPCLWTGSMSPPCQFYSEIVSKIKANILEEVKSERIKTQFTVSTFTQRIRDVWLAIKEENFVFNFQDSVKAIDYNNMCMEVNKLCTDMRFKMMNKLWLWQSKIKECKDSLPSTFNSIQKECKDELHVQKELMTSKLNSYVSQHKRGGILAKHIPLIERNLEFTISDTEKDLLDVLNNDLVTMKMQNDIPSAISKMRIKLRQDAKREAELLRSSNQRKLSKETRTPEDIFCSKWDDWKKERAKDFQLHKVCEKRLEQQCESLVLSITKNTSISKEIIKLTTEEGGPKHHISLSAIDWRKYFPKKGIENAKQWFKVNEKDIEKVLNKSVIDLNENLYHKSFDANLFQFVVQNAFQRFSTPYLTSDPPGIMKAKLLLHVCGKLLDISIKHQKHFENEHSFDRLFEKEKQSLMKDFLSFVKEENQVEQAVECMGRYLKEWIIALTTFSIKSGFPKLMTQHGISNPASRDVLMLQELQQKDNVNEYLKYCKRYIEYHRAWFFEKVVNCYKQAEDGKTFLHLHAESDFETVKSDLCGIVNDIPVTKKANDPNNTTEMFKKWVNLFVKALSVRGFAKYHELASELYTYDISDMIQLKYEIERILSTTWKSDVMKAIGIQEDNLESVSKFVKRALGKELQSALKMLCTEQCPLCRSPCDNILPRGPTHEHYSFTHLPRGISGVKDSSTSQLIIDDCVTCVTSSTATYIYPGDPTPRLCKDYKKDFPDWKIDAMWEGAPNFSPYWQSVMAKFNVKLACHYNCRPARIPQSWNNRVTRLSVAMHTNMRISVTVVESSLATTS